MCDSWNMVITNHPKSEQGVTKTRLLSRAEVARLLGVCPHTVQRMERAGRLKSVKFNRRLLRYQETDVQRLLTEAAA